MNNPSRDLFRRRIVNALDRFDGLRTTSSERHLNPVRVTAAGIRPIGRRVRPIRSWDRLVRI